MYNTDNLSKKKPNLEHSFTDIQGQERDNQGKCPYTV